MSRDIPPQDEITLLQAILLELREDRAQRELQEKRFVRFWHATHMINKATADLDDARQNCLRLQDLENDECLRLRVTRQAVIDDALKLMGPE